MPMTFAEKILAAKAGKENVKAGEFVLANVDFALANDITAPVAIQVLHLPWLQRLKATVWY